MRVLITDPFDFTPEEARAWDDHHAGEPFPIAGVYVQRRAELGEAAAELGRKGGQAGKGASKRRGDSAYYKALRAKPRKPKP